MPRRLLMWAFVCLIYGNGPVHAEVITFDTLPAEPRNRTVFGELSVDGYVFSSPHAHIVTMPGRCDTGCADNGTQWVGGDTSSIGMRSDSGTFSLRALDAAEAFADLAKPKTLAVTGTRFGGGVLKAAFAFDGINDSVGGQADFQKFSFSDEWTHLVGVSMLADDDAWFGIDNVMVEAASPSPVPEPATLILSGAGLLATLRVRRRRTR